MMSTGTFLLSFTLFFYETFFRLLLEMQFCIERKQWMNIYFVCFAVCRVFNCTLFVAK